MDDIQDALEGITGARSVNLLILINLLNRFAIFIVILGATGVCEWRIYWWRL